MPAVSVVLKIINTKCKLAYMCFSFAINKTVEIKATLAAHDLSRQLRDYPILRKDTVKEKDARPSGIRVIVLEDSLSYKNGIIC